MGLRLIVDNPTRTREMLVEDAVRAAAHAQFPWGVMHLGMAQVLQKILWTETGLYHFCCEVRLAFQIQNGDENEIASIPRGLA
jgi:hypothetical protein